MSVITTDLPSTVEESLAACPRFRILLVGNSGVGKSSLVASIFNVDLKNIDIAHDRAGRADITHPYECSDNPHFILHDSQGFEPGQTGNWEIATRFLRYKVTQPLKDRIHAIWLCVETPRPGSRLLHVSDEKLLKLAKELEIPVVIVLTKYDVLIRKHENKIKMKLKKDKLTPAESEPAKIDAEKYFMQRIEALPREFPSVGVSKRKEYHYTLQKLTESTRKILHSIKGELWIPWAIAQRVSAPQKVEQSISEGMKKYWRDLGTSTFFQGHNLVSCLGRIHKDVIKVWNFNDPHELLLQESFFTDMVRLSEPLLLGCGNKDNKNDWFSTYSNATSLVSTFGTTLAQSLGAAGIGLFALKFLYQTYETGSRTAQSLAAYIVDLTMILHSLFMETLTQDPPRQLSDDHISDVIAGYEMSSMKSNHDRIRALSIDRQFEKNIAGLILSQI